MHEDFFFNLRKGLKGLSAYLLHNTFAIKLKEKIRCNGSRLSLCSLCVWWLNENPNLQKKKFEDWDFFSKLGKKSTKFHRSRILAPGNTKNKSPMQISTYWYQYILPLGMLKQDYLILNWPESALFHKKIWFWNQAAQKWIMIPHMKPMCRLIYIVYYNVDLWVRLIHFTKLIYSALQISSHISQDFI